jgi:hypothetical protein
LYQSFTKLGIAYFALGIERFRVCRGVLLYQSQEGFRTKRLCIDITGTTVYTHTSLLINGQELTPAKTSAFTFTAQEVNQAGKQASAAPAF